MLHENVFRIALFLLYIFGVQDVLDYFFVSENKQCDTGSQAYFGDGTKLTVLGKYRTQVLD